ncbi:hypothetical protein GW17_00028530 [Ensete ventricosum]|nr:hypothetical protein GW17_00028530 [Ensete ventricosum]
MFVAPFTRIPIPIPICSTTSSSTVAAASRLSRIRGRPCAHSRPLLGPVDRSSKASALSDSLKILEWDKLCDAVASFAGTALGRDATKVSLILLFISILFPVKVKSAITRVSRGSLIDGVEAVAVVGLIQLAETLQNTLKAALKEDAEWYNRFMPLTQMVNCNL